MRLYKTLGLALLLSSCADHSVSSDDKALQLKREQAQLDLTRKQLAEMADREKMEAINKAQAALEAKVRLHLEHWTNDPSGSELRNVRKTPDGQVCGEVNLRDKSTGSLRGFRTFLDPMNGDGPAIAEPAPFQIIGWRKPIDACMTPDQRKNFEKENQAVVAAWEVQMQRKLDASKLRLEEEKLKYMLQR